MLHAATLLIKWKVHLSFAELSPEAKSLTLKYIPNGLGTQHTAPQPPIS